MIPITENENPATADIDKLATLDALRLLNEEDKKVAAAVELALPEIAQIVDAVFARLDPGGRLFYVGTGTSGRLGVLDASELPPTFGVSRDLVQGVIAGGYDALHKAVEASEDDREAGAGDLKSRGLTKKDAVIGIAASGTTPYTIGAIEFARALGCATGCITCSPDSPITEAAEIAVVAVVGPEAIAGSTRMKSGTAQKLILNMISTMVMIKLGYVSGNRMINVRAANKKLVIRSINLVSAETGLPHEKAATLFEAAGRNVKTALVMYECGVDAETANSALERGNLAVRKAVEIIRSK